MAKKPESMKERSIREMAETFTQAAKDAKSFLSLGTGDFDTKGTIKPEALDRIKSTIKGQGIIIIEEVERLDSQMVQKMLDTVTAGKTKATVTLTPSPTLKRPKR
jgi:hypothetical protein